MHTAWDNFLDAYNSILTFSENDSVRTEFDPGNILELLKRCVTRMETSINEGAVRIWIQNQISVVRTPHTISLINMLDVSAKIHDVLEKHGAREFLPMAFREQNFTHSLADNLWELLLPPLGSPVGDIIPDSSSDKILSLLQRLSNRESPKAIQFALLLHVGRRLIAHQYQIEWQKDIAFLSETLSNLIHRNIQQWGVKGDLVKAFWKILAWTVLSLPELCQDNQYMYKLSEVQNILTGLSFSWKHLGKCVLISLFTKKADISSLYFGTFFRENCWNRLWQDDFMNRSHTDKLIDKLRSASTFSFIIQEDSSKLLFEHRKIPRMRRLTHFLYVDVLEEMGLVDELAVHLFLFIVFVSWSAERAPCIDDWREWLVSIPRSQEAEENGSSAERVDSLAQHLHQDTTLSITLQSDEMLSEYVFLVLHRRHVARAKSAPEGLIIRALLDGLYARFAEPNASLQKTAALVGMQFSSSAATFHVTENLNDSINAFSVDEYQSQFDQWRKDLCFLDKCVDFLHDSGWWRGKKSSCSEKISANSNSQKDVDDLVNATESLSFSESATKVIKDNSLQPQAVDTNLLHMISRPSQAEINLFKGKSISMLSFMICEFERLSCTGVTDQSNILRFANKYDSSERVADGTSPAMEFHEDRINAIDQYYFILSIVLPCKIDLNMVSVEHSIPNSSPSEIANSCESLLRVLLYSPAHIIESMPCRASQKNSCVLQCGCAKCARDDLAALVVARSPNIAVDYLCREYYAKSNTSLDLNTPHAICSLMWILKTLHRALMKVQLRQVLPLQCDILANRQIYSLRELPPKPSSMDAARQVIDRPMGKLKPKVPRYPPLRSSDRRKSTESVRKLCSDVTRPVNLNNASTTLTSLRSFQNDPSDKSSTAESLVNPSAFLFNERLFLGLLPPKADQKPHIAHAQNGNFLLNYPFIFKNPVLVALQLELLTATFQLLFNRSSGCEFRFFKSQSSIFFAQQNFLELLVSSYVEGRLDATALQKINVQTLFLILRCVHIMFSHAVAQRNASELPEHHGQRGAHLERFLCKRPVMNFACHLDTVGVSDRFRVKKISPSSEKGLQFSTAAEYWQFFVQCVVESYSSTHFRYEKSSKLVKCLQIASEIKDLLASAYYS